MTKKLKIHFPMHMQITCAQLLSQFFIPADYTTNGLYGYISMPCGLPFSVEGLLMILKQLCSHLVFMCLPLPVSPTCTHTCAYIHMQVTFSRPLSGDDFEVEFHRGYRTSYRRGTRFIAELGQTPKHDHQLPIKVRLSL